MLTRKSYNPLTSFNPFDSLFDDIFSTSGLTRLGGVEFKVNEDGSAAFTLDLPGVKQEDLSVEATENLVHVKAERKTKTSSCSVNKSFSISEKYDPGTLSADLENGVLTLTVQPHKVQERQSRKIAISNKR
jgi:HSP20 family molecular chaperone IbpA